MILRKATIDDAALLLTWRNDEETRRASFNTETILLEDHLHWLNTVLANPARQLFIAEIDSVPVGTCRADTSADGIEMSWTVAPEHRHKGIGTEMVKKLIAVLNGKVYAEIKPHNLASIRIAQASGLILQEQRADVLIFAQPS